MSLTRRLRLDDVISSFPELGPTIPDGGYSWIVLVGVSLIQMSVRSVLPIYGVVLGYLENDSRDNELWSEKIILTPILFTAFWCLADSWTKTVVELASVPRLVGLIGVILLSVGIVASGYLATGGVGAYLASLSAGAVMGIGASFVIEQSNNALQKCFRVNLVLAITIRNVAAAVGLIFAPIFTYRLLLKAGFKTGLLLITTVFIPAALGVLTLRSPVPQRVSPYRLLLSEDDNELPIRISSETSENVQEQNDELENSAYTEERVEDAQSFCREGNNVYSYQEPEEDLDLYVKSNFKGKWQQELEVFKSFRFWIAAVAWIGVRVCPLFFWTLLPVIFIKKSSELYAINWVIMLPVVAGCSVLIPSITSYWMLGSESERRRIYFGGACWTSSLVLIGLSYVVEYSQFIILALLGGLSIGSLSACHDIALQDIFGVEFAQQAHKAFFTVVGLCILIFCFIHNINVCLRLVAVLLFIGGCYWVFAPGVSMINTRRQKNLYARTNRGSQ